MPGPTNHPTATVNFFFAGIDVNDSPGLLAESKDPAKH
jgi:hypothetical protein